MSAGFGLLLALGLFSASPAQAHCGKGVTELLKFAMDDLPASFTAWNAAAEQFCPNVFITRDVPATAQDKEVWFIKFDETYPGADADETADWIIKQLTPMLKADGYQDKPSGSLGDMGLDLTWDAPSKPHILVEVVEKEPGEVDDHPGKTLYEVKVWHHVN